MASKSPTKSGGGSGKKMTMASALLGEKLAHLRADLRLGLYRLSHPSLPKEDREAAEESTIVQKSVATEKRRQQEAKARAIANEKKLAKRKSQAMRAGFSSPL
ncbi:hypothetical protein M758_3G000900 [Ceratodon purpureus]|uniref:Uncharacterized protein n=1 Tax=Ceratodon purpureus TaxID=3225 RepID=A0A8T0IEA5_CERPU|nr:hypothetical protein KC19_3G003500 [Ceratodon purpureus]KAG0621189.1 hypothetical protein M758_3G000900 [Ceratodon purpureus]